MAKQQRGLGKGLSALFGEDDDFVTFRKPVQYVNASPSAAKTAKGGEILSVEISKIEPNPYQPRVTFDEQALAELAASIKSLGLIQPITVRSIGEDRYQIISGERRFRASKLAGLTTIPAYIRTADDTGMLEMAIVENVQRYDLDPIETAMSYQRLIEECHLTQEQMADRIGKSRVAVTNFLRLLRLPAKVQYDVKVGNISVGHAKALLGLSDPIAQEALSDETIRQGLSVRTLEQRVRDFVNAPSRPSSGVKASDVPSTPLPEHFSRAVEWIGKYFDNNVSVKRSADGKGTMTIRFKNDRQMQDFCKMLEDKNL